MKGPKEDYGHDKDFVPETEAANTDEDGKSGENDEQEELVPKAAKRRSVAASQPKPKKRNKKQVRLAHFE